MPLNSTWSLLIVVLKFVPEIWIVSPTAPLPGLNPEIVGGGTEKFVELVPVSPPVETEIGPVVAPVGTVAITRVVEALVTVPCTPLNKTVLLAIVEPKFDPLIVTDVPTMPLPGLKLVIAGGTVTVKLAVLVAVCPFVVTVILPVVAPLGTFATNCVEFAELTVAAVPLNLTVLLLGVLLKLVPVTVTGVPTGPLPGLKPVIVGGCTTVKFIVLVPVRDPTVTVIAPVVAAEGTVTTSCVVVADDTVAVVPLNLTVSFVFVALKFKPVIVTEAPTTPLVGVKLVMDGATVKLPLLVPVLLPTVTDIVPVVAVVGTVATSLVVVADVTAATVPLNLTVLLEIVELKFVPLMVTEVPGAPLVGLKLVTVGDAASALDVVASNPRTSEAKQTQRIHERAKACLTQPSADIDCSPNRRLKKTTDMCACRCWHTRSVTLRFLKDGTSPEFIMRTGCRVVNQIAAIRTSMSRARQPVNIYS